MKTLLTLFLLVFSLSFLIGQSCLPNGITFSTQTDIEAFANNYPDCTEIAGDIFIHVGNPNGVYDFSGLQNITAIGGSLVIQDPDGNSTKENLMGLENLTSIGGSLVIGVNENLNFKSLHGLEGLTSIGANLTLSELSIDDLSGLDNLTSIGGSVSLEFCELNNFQGLEQIDTIPGGFSLAYTNLNDFSGLNSLEAILGDIFLFFTSFDNFQGLESLSHLGGLNSSVDDLQNFRGLENLNSIERRIDLIDSSIKNFEGLNQLREVEKIRLIACGQVRDFKGLSNLRSLEKGIEIEDCKKIISFKGLEQVETLGEYLDLVGNDSLISINELENVDFSELLLVYLSENMSLSFCESIPLCNYLADGGDYFLEGNAPGCSEITEILANCEDNLSKVRYFTYYDINQNQIFDTNEFFYSDASIQVNPFSYLNFDNTEYGGTLYLEPGDYNLSLNANNSWGLTTVTDSYPINIAAPNSCDTIYFGLNPLIEESFLMTAIQSPPARCLEYISFEVTSKNIGTTIESGTLWLEIDPEILDVEFIDHPDTLVAPYRYGWHFNDLYPSQSISRLISLQIPGPPDFELGQVLNFFTFINFVDQPWVQKANGFRYQPEVRCSFDPNDKLVHPNRDGNYTLFDEWLIYTIRFQNTGNDLAYDVVIRDTLDANLDASSFLVLGSSHETELSTTLEDGQFLTFDFSNIFLPDSTTDLEGSQGYVSYLIKGKEGLAENTAIENTASIYFDLNPPIVTNTTQNVMVSQLPTTATSTLSPNRFNIFPNPTTDLVQVQYQDVGKVEFQMSNMVGQLLSSGTFTEQTSFSMKSFPSGVYWLQLNTDAGSITQKIIHVHSTEH